MNINLFLKVVGVLQKLSWRLLLQHSQLEQFKSNVLAKCPNVRNIAPKVQITNGSKPEWCKYDGYQSEV